MKFIGIIPARYASTRFPGKPLADMKGKYMIQRVYEQVKTVLDRVYVATDDRRIFDAVHSFGGKAVMTSENHKSGTDRCLEAYSRIGEGEDVIINKSSYLIFSPGRNTSNPTACRCMYLHFRVWLVKPFTKEDGFDALFNSNSPKVVLNNRNEALYFSRSIIPYIRNYKYDTWLDHHVFYKHIGMYAYRADVLSEITALPQSSLEIAESLEQLRWLQNGYRIKVGITTQETIGIDTPEDLERALKYL